MNHYITQLLHEMLIEGMQIVIVVLYCVINSITIVILVVDCFHNKSLYGSKIYIHLINILLHIGVRGGGAGGAAAPPIFRHKGKSGNLCLKSRAI